MNEIGVAIVQKGASVVHWVRFSWASCSDIIVRLRDEFMDDVRASSARGGWTVCALTLEGTRAPSGEKMIRNVDPGRLTTDPRDVTCLMCLSRLK
jgi:hypothetical protein